MLLSVSSTILLLSLPILDLSKLEGENKDMKEVKEHYARTEWFVVGTYEKSLPTLFSLKFQIYTFFSWCQKLILAGIPVTCKTTCKCFNPNPLVAPN